MSIQDLHHVTVGEQGNGPFVLVLQDGAIITAEDRAMLQALYSRSPASVLEHLDKLHEVGSGKFMESYYVGYGHKSIGDCGDTTIFIEGVSMLVAKAIQDSMLYDGQEVSTRYLDFATQPFVDPLILGEKGVLADLRTFYIEALPELKKYLKEKHPIMPGEKDSVYEKAVAARAFDILRGFLPAGAQTNLAWTTNLRQAADRIAILREHPLSEVRLIAVMLEKALQQAHPHSFVHKRYPVSDMYRKTYMANDYYYKPTPGDNGVKLVNNFLDKSMLETFSNVISGRPDKTELPKFVASSGVLQFSFTLDFGSFRDLARQRAVVQRMPLLTPSYGFHEWYMDQLSEELRMRATSLAARIAAWWEGQIQKIDQTILQYYLPMGYRVPCFISGDLPALVYLVELRSGSTVHATLREISQSMGSMIESLGIKVYIDMSDSGRFDIKRGTQDIVSV